MAVLERGQITDYASELGRMMEEEGLTEAQILDKVGKDLAAVSGGPGEAQKNLDIFLDVIGPSGGNYVPESENIRRDIGMSYGGASTFGTQPGAYSAPGALDTGITTIDTGDMTPPPAAQQPGAGDGVSQVTFYLMPDGTVGRAAVGESVPQGATVLNAAQYAALSGQQPTGGIETAAPDQAPGGFEYRPFEYTEFPQAQGGVYGPGQGMPMIFQPAAPAPAPTGAAVPAPQQPVTYSYPQPFGDVDIFNRVSPAITSYNPNPTGS
jgi:hypothetical protein